MKMGFMPNYYLIGRRTSQSRLMSLSESLGSLLNMLLYQAVRGFQMWFGVRPEVTPQLRALVEKDLGK